VLRYLAICHGLRCHVTGKMARISIVLIWTFATSIMSPWAVFYQQLEHVNPRPPTGNTSDVTTLTTTTSAFGFDVEYVCMQRWPSERMERNYFLAAIFVTCYTIPLPVMRLAGRLKPFLFIYLLTYCYYLCSQLRQFRFRTENISLLHFTRTCCALQTFRVIRCIIYLLTYLLTRFRWWSSACVTR